MTALRSTRLAAPDDVDAVTDVLEAGGWGDGLPLLPPTADRVERAIRASGRDPAEVVAVLPPRHGFATVEKIAINAVMAGCRPADLAVVLAAIEAVAVPEFNVGTNQVTSNPAGVLVIVNGPLRTELSMVSGANCMGHGTRPNVAIGRAVRLVLQNIGGAPVGVVDRATQGFPGKIAFCFAEAEEASPWEPLHVSRGLSPRMSAVTVVAALGTSNIIVHGRPVAADLLPTLAHGMINPGANNFASRAGDAVLVLNPGHAQALAADGVTRADLQRYLFEHARVPLDWYPARAQEVANMHERAIDGTLPVAASPDRILVVVAGVAGSHSTFIPTTANCTSVTRPI